MKKTKLLLLITAAALCMTACSFNALDDKHQKVSRALNAVENSINKEEKNKSKAPLLLGDDFSDLNNDFANASHDERLEEQLRYDTPPFIQFKYMKAIYDRLGNSCDFGNAYAYDLTGTGYIDFETGFKDKEKKEENKFTYVFNLSISLNIDENDLITANVGMQIELNHKNEKLHNYKYVRMELNYDFSKNNDNYELALYDEGREGELAYLHCDYGYEYNYVKVQNNEIEDWKKFRYEADEVIKKDDSHATLDSYINAGVSITTDNNRWYKNKTLYRVDSNTEEALDIAKKLFANHGLNSNEIGTDAFFNKEKTSSSAIKDIYEESSKQYGDDLIYSIIGRNDSGKPEDSKAWPRDVVNQFTGIDGIVFSSNDSYQYEYSIEENEGTPALTINAINASHEDFISFMDVLVTQYDFISSGETLGIYTLIRSEMDGTALIAAIVPGQKSIIFMKGTSEPGASYYGKVEIPGAYNFEGYFSGYQLDYFSNEKDIASVLNNHSFDGSYFLGKINAEASLKVTVNIDEDATKEAGVKSVEELAEKEFNGYINQYYSWKVLEENRLYYLTESSNSESLIFIEPIPQIGTMNIILIKFTEPVIDDYFTPHEDGGDDYSESSEGEPVNAIIHLYVYEGDNLVIENDIEALMDTPYVMYLPPELRDAINKENAIASYDPQGKKVFNKSDTIQQEESDVYIFIKENY